MKKSNEELNSIITDICENKEFNILKDKTHHGISRYDHSMRVAYYTYLTTKFLKLNYKEATRGALLHDFFIDEVKNLNSINRFRKHPEYANQVLSGKITWQQLYEIYEIYGENNDILNNYSNNSITNSMFNKHKR